MMFFRTSFNDNPSLFVKLKDVKAFLPTGHVVHTVNGDFYVNVKALEIFGSGRNKYLYSMRARREMLGLNIPQAAILTGELSYKAKECGRRMTLDEFAAIMSIFDEYEVDPSILDDLK